MRGMHQSVVSSNIAALLRLKLLLSCAVNVNSADYDKRAALVELHLRFEVVLRSVRLLFCVTGTCLHLACSEGHVNVVQTLIKNNAELNPRDRFEATPLMDALRKGHNECARLVIDHGGVVSYEDLAAAGELCEMARTGKVDQLQLLLEGRCNVNAVDYDLRSCVWPPYPLR